jgi:tetratricopeptide (TPR) repeat protein
LRGYGNRWSEAAGDLARALELNPGDDKAAFDLAIALLKSGRLDDYRRHCHQFLKRAMVGDQLPKADKAAKVALLLPVDGADRERATELADRVASFAATSATAAADPVTPWFNLCKALAELRRKHFESAIDWSNRVTARRQAARETQAAAFFIAASAHDGLGHADAAREAVARGNALVNQTTWNVITESTRDWLVAELLHGQAVRQSRATVDAMSALGWAYYGVARYEDGARLLDQSLAAQKRRLGVDDPDTLATMRYLALTYTHLDGRLKDALALMEDVVRRKRASGPPDPATMDAVRDLGAMYRQAKRYDQALPLLEESLTYFRQTAGAEHVSTLYSMNALAEAYREIGRAPEAIDLAKTVLDVRRRTVGDKSIDTFYAMWTLAQDYLTAGRTDEAMSLLRERVRLAKQQFGSADPRTIQISDQLAQVERKWNRQDGQSRPTTRPATAPARR